MPWWSWLVIWGSLVLGMLAMLALFALWIFRKFIVLTDDVSALFDLADEFDIPHSEYSAPALAVLADITDVRRREEARKAHRADRRWSARQRRLSRARTITRRDASIIRWPEAWYVKPVKRKERVSSTRWYKRRGLDKLGLFTRKM